MPSTVSVLDWGVYTGWMSVDVYGQHQAAKALRDLAATAKKLGEFGGALKIYSRDGDAKDQAQAAHLREMTERANRLDPQLQLDSRAPNPLPGSDVEASQSEDSAPASNGVTGDDRSS